MDENGSGNGKVYVRFGDLPTQEMPIEWAEKMLSLWRERHVMQFAKVLGEVATGGQK
jgi:hypothetical protein